MEASTVRADHVHGCLACRPDMVPDFQKADRRYHSYEVCGTTLAVRLDGIDPGYTDGVYEGNEGWVLFVGVTHEEIHACPNCLVRDADGFLAHHTLCVEALFGRVTVIHQCPVPDRARPFRRVSVSPSDPHG